MNLKKTIVLLLFTVLFPVLLAAINPQPEPPLEINLFIRSSLPESASNLADAAAVSQIFVNQGSVLTPSIPMPPPKTGIILFDPGVVMSPTLPLPPPKG